MRYEKETITKWMKYDTIPAAEYLRRHFIMNGYKLFKL